MYKGILETNQKRLNNSRTILEYGMALEGEYINLTETLNSLLGDKVHIEVKDLNKDDCIFNEEGKLLYQKLGKGYQLFVGKNNLDYVLRKNLNQKIGVGIKCLAEREETIK